MRSSRGFETNDYHNSMSFHDLDQIKQQPTRRYSPIRLNSNNREYPNGDHTYRSAEPKKSNVCSKPCLIGLCIGLLIGIALVIAIAVPIGVTRCGGNSIEVIQTTCPTTTVSTTTVTSSSCIGVISSTPNWTGTYLMDSSCYGTVSCCCLYNLITVNQTAAYQITITGYATGSCTSSGTTVLFTTTTQNGFQAGFFWNLEAIRVQLGRDNSYLSFVNTARPYCSATALRRS